MNDGKAEVTGTTGLNHDQEVKRRGGVEERRAEERSNGRRSELGVKELTGPKKKKRKNTITITITAREK